MSNENEHWCCGCFHYRGDTSIGEICDLTGESIYDSRPRNSRSCDKWEECICGPLTWVDIKAIVNIADDLLPGHDTEQLLSEFQTEEAYYKEVLRRFNEDKK